MEHGRPDGQPGPGRLQAAAANSALSLGPTFTGCRYAAIVVSPEKQIPNVLPSVNMRYIQLLSGRKMVSLLRYSHSSRLRQDCLHDPHEEHPDGDECLCKHNLILLPWSSGVLMVAGPGTVTGPGSCEGSC